MNKISLNEFKNKYFGTSVDVPWGYKGECVSLVQRYLNECYGLPLKRRGNANEYGNKLISDKDAREINKRELEPGDLIVWDGKDGVGKGYGHIAIWLGNNLVFDQNRGGDRTSKERPLLKNNISQCLRIMHIRPDNGGFVGKDYSKVASLVKLGRYGNGQSRIIKLQEAGYSLEEIKIIQSLVNGETYASLKEIDVIANEVINGIWGNGQNRKEKLVKAGYDYDQVQQRVNEILKGQTSTTLKSNDVIAQEVINGRWGNGEQRKKNLIAAGYDYNAIQKIVNQKLK